MFSWDAADFRHNYTTTVFNLSRIQKMDNNRISFSLCSLILIPQIDSDCFSMYTLDIGPIDLCY